MRGLGDNYLRVSESRWVLLGGRIPPGGAQPALGSLGPAGGSGGRRGQGGQQAPPRLLPGGPGRLGLEASDGALVPRARVCLDHALQVVPAARAAARAVGRGAIAPAGASPTAREWRECMTRERWQARRRAPSRAKGGFCRSFIKSRLFRERHPRRVYRANSRVYRRSVRHRVRDGAAGPQPPEAFEVSREPRYHAIEAAGRTSVCRTWRPPRPCQPHRSMQSTFPAWILQGKDSTTPRIRHVEGSGLKGNQTCLPAFLAHTKIPTAVFSSCTLARESIDFRGVEWAAHIPSPCFSEPCAPSRI